MPEYTWITDEIFTVADFFTAAECAEHIRLAESLGFADVPINSTFGAEVRKDVRNNSRVIHDDAVRADDLWQRAAVYVPTVVGDWCDRRQ